MWKIMNCIKKVNSGAMSQFTLTFHRAEARTLILMGFKTIKWLFGWKFEKRIKVLYFRMPSFLKISKNLNKRALKVIKKLKY